MSVGFGRDQHLDHPKRLPLAQCQRLHPGAGGSRLLAARYPPANVRRVEQQNAANLLDRVRVRLRRVSGTDDVFGVDALEMRARILDDTVVAAFDRPIAGNRDDRMRMDTGGTRGCGHRLEDRVVWRHAEQAARTQGARVDLEVAGIPREFDAGPDDAQWESKKRPWLSKEDSHTTLL